ncbi:hypothetical protein TNCV_3446711 [Trichonephila clavipes]|nr:hypothetical protein TNCV_3446711 [Trichonephila clavipes]
MANLPSNSRTLMDGRIASNRFVCETAAASFHIAQQRALELHKNYLGALELSRSTPMFQRATTGVQGARYLHQCSTVHPNPRWAA